MHCVRVQISRITKPRSLGPRLSQMRQVPNPSLSAFSPDFGLSLPSQDLESNLKAHRLAITRHPNLKNRAKFQFPILTAQIQVSIHGCASVSKTPSFTSPCRATQHSVPLHSPFSTHHYRFHPELLRTDTQPHTSHFSCSCHASPKPRTQKIYNYISIQSRLNFSTSRLLINPNPNRINSNCSLKSIVLRIDGTRHGCFPCSRGFRDKERLEFVVSIRVYLLPFGCKSTTQNASPSLILSACIRIVNAFTSCSEGLVAYASHRNGTTLLPGMIKMTIDMTKRMKPPVALHIDCRLILLLVCLLLPNVAGRTYSPLRRLQASGTNFADGGWFPYFNDVLISHPCAGSWTYRNSSGDFAIASACVSLEAFVPFGLDREINDEAERLNVDTNSAEWCSTQEVYEPVPEGNDKSGRKLWGFCLSRGGNGNAVLADGGLQEAPTPCVSKWRYMFADKSERILVDPCVSFQDLQPYGYEDDSVQLFQPTLPDTDTSRWCSTSLTYNVANEVNRTKWGYCSVTTTTTAPPTSAPQVPASTSPSASPVTATPGETPAPSPAVVTAAPSVGSGSGQTPAPSSGKTVLYADGGGQVSPVKCAERWEYKKENKDKVLMPSTCITFAEFQPYGFDDPSIRIEPTLSFTNTSLWCSTLPIHNPFNLINRTSWGYCATSNTEAPTRQPTQSPSTSAPTQPETLAPTSPTQSPSSSPSSMPIGLSQSPTGSPAVGTVAPSFPVSTSPTTTTTTPSNSLAPTAATPAPSPSLSPQEQFEEDMEVAFGLESFSTDDAQVTVPSWLGDEGVVSAAWNAEDSQLLLEMDAACTPSAAEDVASAIKERYPTYAFDAACMQSGRRVLQAGNTAVVKLCAAEPCEANTSSQLPSGTQDDPDITLIVVIAVAAVLLVVVLAFAVQRWRRSRTTSKRSSSALGPALSSEYKVERTKDAINVELPQSMVPQPKKQPRPNVQIDFDKLNAEQAQLVASQPFFADLHQDEQQKTLEVIDKHNSRLEAQQKKASKRELAKPRSSKLVQQMEAKSKSHGGSKYIQRTCATCQATYYSVSGRSILCLNCRANRVPPKSVQKANGNENGRGTPHPLNHAKSSMSPPKRQSSRTNGKDASVGHFFGNGETLS